MVAGSLLLLVAAAGPARADLPEPGPEIAVPECEGEGVVGQVVALSGAALAQAPGREPRSLACDDAVFACETLITSSGSEAGLLLGDVYVQVDAGTRVQLDERGGAPVLRLRDGSARVVDGRAAGGAFEVTTPQGVVRGAPGADAEIWLRGTETRVCAHDAGLEIAAAGAAAVAAEPGTCALLTARGVQPAEGAEASIAVADALACGFDADVAQLFEPTDVAAPPFGFGAFPDVTSAEPFRRSPCDDPGSGCAGIPTLPPTPTRGPPLGGPGPIFQDPNPGTGCGGDFGCGPPGQIPE